MELKGLSEFRKHLTDLESNRDEARLWLLLTAAFVLTTLFFIWVDRVIPDWMPDGEIIVVTLGFLCISLFYSRKQVYLQKFGEFAYRNALARFYIPGSGIIFASLLHLTYMPGPEIPNLWWKTLLIILGWCFILVGIGLFLRTFLAIGVDNFTSLYVYFPEEGRMLDSNIFAILRHPVCASILRLGIGLALISGNWFSLLVAVLLPLGFTGWVRLVVEKELLQRFGQNYIEYRKRTPAFWAKPRDLFKLTRFLLAGE